MVFPHQWRGSQLVWEVFLPMSSIRQQPANLQKFLGEAKQDVEKGIPARIFSDPEIYDLEMERLFAKTWVFLAHESEIPSPGDYVVRYITNDSFIVARDEKGKIQVLLNVCRHRGMEIAGLTAAIRRTSAVRITGGPIPTAVT